MGRYVSTIGEIATDSAAIKAAAAHPLRMRQSLDFMAAREVATTAHADPGRHVGTVHAAALPIPLVSELWRIRSACGTSVHPTGGA